MIGAIFGDIVGSVHEHARTRTTRFPLFTERSHFTDDTVLTIATAQALLTGEPYDRSYRAWGRRYRHAGYGRAFRGWLDTNDAPPYNSFGNGSAMRVSPVAYARDTIDDVLDEAERSAVVTHNHVEGIKGAQAVALVVFLARTGVQKSEIRHELGNRFGYDLSRTVERIRPSYEFDVTCQGSVPEALIAFLETDGLTSAVKTAISLGGDADTQAAIAGAASAAFAGGMSEALRVKVRQRLPADMLEVRDAFESRYGC
jgi:ADP-ribosylglycohydrolase